MSAASILPIDPATYTRHALHGEDRIWTETNCYVDVWIEVLHAYGLDPVAMLPFTLVQDFEGDQFTFFKPQLSDLYALYGIDVQELAIWRPLLDHVVEQTRLGRPVFVEMDSYFLPDTAGVAYQLDHVKSTIAVNQIDTDARTLSYFHNQTYFSLSGDDFDGVFRIGAHTPTETVLPPYCELMKPAQIVRRSSNELRTIAVDLTHQYIMRRPRANPISAFRARFGDDMAWLLERDMATFHVYAFATIRQCGACYELATSFIRWLAERGETGLEPVIEGLSTIATTAKTLQFKVARTVATKRQADLAPLFETMESAWDTTMRHLDARYGG